MGCYMKQNECIISHKVRYCKLEGTYTHFHFKTQKGQERILEFTKQ